jgi:hypothetical protein
MKHFIFLLVAIVLVPLVARPQALPDAPSPAPPPDPMWNRVKDLANGAAIVVRNDNGPPVHCLFAGATDAYLFCDPPGNPPNTGFRFDRAAIVSVDLDRPAPYSARFDRSHPNYHPAYLACIIGGGLITGIVATRTMDAGEAASTGVIGAVVVAAIGAPLAFLPHAFDDGFANQPRGFGRMYSPVFGFHPRPLPRLFHAR